MDAVLSAGLDRRERRDGAAIQGVPPRRDHRLPARGDRGVVHRRRCAATLHTAGKYNIENGADAAQALRPLAGEYAYLLFAAGLFNASLFAASILPISTAYAVCEGLGLESGLDKRFDEAPAFYWLYTVLIVFGAGVVLIPGFPLFRIMVLSQVVNGVLLPFVLIFVLMLINDHELMGTHTNSRW
jgi:Mn2+/Fe2+ NRAMP family transporter